MRAVVLGVMTAGLGVVLFGVAGMTVGAVGVVRRLLVIAGFMMLGGFPVVNGSVFVVFRRFLVVFCAWMCTHRFHLS